VTNIGGSTMELGIAGAAVATKRTILDNLEKVVDLRWVERTLSEVFPSEAWGAASPHHPLTLWKVLLIKRWYDLSEADLLTEIRDRKSLTRFVGEEVWDERLNERVIEEFERELRDRKVLDYLFDAVDERIHKKGYGRSRGYLVDPQLVLKGGVSCKAEKEGWEP